MFSVMMFGALKGINVYILFVFKRSELDLNYYCI